MKSEKIEKPIVIATSEKLYQRIVQCHPDSTEVFSVTDPEVLSLVLADSLDALLCLDLSLFNNDVEHPTLKRILKEAYEQLVVVMTDESDLEKLLQLMEQGVRGFWHSAIDAALLRKSIQAVTEGELWITRHMLSYMVSKYLLARSREGVAATDSASLTAIEKEVAICVARGKCDKVIARELSISPNTVKNHLQSIYNKLQVSNRYQLGLMYAGLTVH
ncbi:MAG: response regulator transcription factor [Methylomicrobium sp.]